MIPFIHVQKRQNYRDRKWLSGCLEWEDEGNWRVMLKGVDCQCDENGLKLIVVMAAQLCEYTKIPLDCIL